MAPKRGKSNLSMATLDCSVAAMLDWVVSIEEQAPARDSKLSSKWAPNSSPPSPSRAFLSFS